MAVERRNYRKVYQRIWRNPEFHDLSGDGKVLALYLLTGPQTNRVGMFRFSAASAAEDLGQSVEGIQATLSDVCLAFGWRWDGISRVLLIPSWWVFNPLSEGTRNLSGYLSDLNDVPRTVLVKEFCANLEDIPDGQRHLIQAWEPALTLRVPCRDTVGGTVEDGVADPALTTSTKTCTKTKTSTSTDLGARQNSQTAHTDAAVVKPMAPAGRSDGVWAGSLPKDHINHADCSPNFAVCIPSPVHAKLKNALAPMFRGDRTAADAALREWYRTVWDSLPSQFVMGDAFRFWQGRFDAKWASSADPPKAVQSVASVQAEIERQNDLRKKRPHA